MSDIQAREAYLFGLRINFEQGLAGYVDVQTQNVQDWQERMDADTKPWPNKGAQTKRTRSLHVIACLANLGAVIQAGVYSGLYSRYDVVVHHGHGH